MNVIQFPKQKPAPWQLELPRAQIVGVLHELSNALVSSQLDVTTADTAEAFAAAIAEAHRKVTEASAGFSGLVEATRHWR